MNQRGAPLTSSRNVTLISMTVLASIAYPSGAAPRIARGDLAARQCASVIKKRPGQDGKLRPMPMPRACYGFGTGALGGPMTDLFGRLGTPDALTYARDYLHSENGLWSKGMLEVSYLYPRNLNAVLTKRGRSKVDYSMLSVLARDGKIRAARVVEFAGLHVGDSEDRVYRIIGKPTHINTPHDVLFYDPYPLTIGVNPATKKVIGFSVSLTEQDIYGVEGAAPFEIRNSSGKIVGIKLHYVGLHK